MVYKRPEGTVDGTSEYKKQYLGKWGVRARMIRPSEVKPDDKGIFDHKSTQASDFVSLPLPPKVFHGVKHAYEPPKELFEGKSTIKSDFVDFGPVGLTPSLKPQQIAKVSSEPFHATSCYKTSFTPQKIPKRYEKPKEVYVPTEGEFDGMTTVKSDFPAHMGVQPVDILRPPQKPIASDFPFEGNTESRLSYRTWELPSRHSRPATLYAPPTERFATQTTFKDDYPDYGWVEPAKILKPPQRTRDQAATLESLTTQKNDFKTWNDVERPTVIQREKKYEAPTETFDAVSTFTAHYKGDFAARAPSAKPSEAPYTRSSAMERSTEYRDSFSPSGHRPCPALYLSESGKSPAEYTFSHQDAESGHKFFSPLKSLEDPKTAPVVTA